jgi:hypothetical protein
LPVIVPKPDIKERGVFVTFHFIIFSHFLRSLNQKFVSFDTDQRTGKPALFSETAPEKDLENNCASAVSNSNASRHDNGDAGDGTSESL